MIADLHIHSSYSSDGRSSVSEILKAAEMRGLGCIAITDHNVFRAHEDVYDGNVIIIPAEEVSSSDGHILAYGINAEIVRGKGVEETIDMIHDAGGIAVAAHPYRWWSGLGESNVTERFDAIETFNARSTEGSNGRAVRLAEKMNKPFTGGSDAHNAACVGDAYTELPDGVSDWEGVIKEILAGNVKVAGRHRARTDTVKYGYKSITEWIGRGFRKM
ncbi:MAG: PHP domain-containing protein [Methanomassiliicoccaceae archaeon]|nr:PHP domain-containing protein [Methanomassiliicoccaceae archaeon]